MSNIHIVKDGYPFIIVSILVAILLGALMGEEFAIIPLVFAVYFVYFFRNPDRNIKIDDSILYSPTDGTVMAIDNFYDEEFLNEDAVKVTIFLSVFDVHVNRCPMGGEIKYQRYTCGSFVPAYKEKAPVVNERHAIGLENGKNRILVIQIAGILARRIVSWVTLGRTVKQGQCYGMIKFGSSTELVVPKSVEILVHKGDKVKGGITVIGRQKN